MVETSGSRLVYKGQFLEQVNNNVNIGFSEFTLNSSNRKLQLPVDETNIKVRLIWLKLFNNVIKVDQLK